MDYDGLQMFLELSRSLHFLRASRACHVSPSTLSRAVQRLEQETGSAAARARSALGPADRRRAARFAEHARDTLERWQRLQRDLRGRARHAVGQHRDLRVGDRLPELPPRAARRVPRAPSRRPHPARDRLRGRRAGAAGRGARRRQRRGDPAAAAARRSCRACCCTRRWCSRRRAWPCEVERLCHQRPLPWAELPVVLPASGHARDSADRWFRRRRIVPQRLRRGPRQRGDPRAGQPRLRRRHRAAPGARREPAARQAAASSTPTTAARRWASSASASAPSARSWRRRWCARCGIRSPPRNR